MGRVLAKFQIRSVDIDVDMDKLSVECNKILSKHGSVGQMEINPVAFGLKEIIAVLVLPGDKGGTDAIEEELNKIEGVDRAEVIDVRLAFG